MEIAESSKPRHREITVLVAEDESLDRRAFTLLLRQEAGIRLVGSVGRSRPAVLARV